MTKALAIRQLLDCWNTVTGQSTRMVPAVERALFEFSRFYTLADLQLTLTYIMQQNKKSTSPWSLAFSKFFDDEFRHFESIRSQAEQHQRAMEAKKRAWKPSAGEIARAEMIHTEPQPPETPAKHVDSLPLIQALKKTAQ